MSFEYSFPYATPRLPVFARNLVSTSHPAAATAGVRMLLAGGNAVDAAIAAAAALTVVEPVSNGLGGDAFCILWDGRQLHGLNASGRAPAAWSREYFTRKYGEASRTPPKRGADSVTVPGAVAGWVALSERFGRLPFADLMAPAIELAERGCVVPAVVGWKWAAAVAELQGQPGFAEAFLPHGRAPRIGELFRFAAAARTLRRIAETRGEDFYRGEIAADTVRFLREQGAVISGADFAECSAEWLAPVSAGYRGYELHQMPPNGQGVATLVALGLLRRFDLASLPVDGAQAQHLQIEAMKLAFADVYRYVAEPASMEVTPEEMLDEAYLESRARLIDPRRAQAFQAGTPGDVHRRGGTVYLSAADAQGMMVSFIQSNYMGFGSGVVVPDWGVSLHNRGFGFSLDARSPNLVAPGKRPFHTIMPGFLTQAGQPQMSFGVMGANMQPQGQMQTLVRMLDQGQNPQAACDAPRWRFNSGLSVDVEASMDRKMVAELQQFGHRIETAGDSYQDFGAGQFLWRLGDPGCEGYVAASDPRRDGQAVGF